MSRGGGSQQAPAAPAKPCQWPRLVEHSPEAPGGRPHPHRHGPSGGQRSSVPARGDTLGRLRAGTGGQPWAGPGPQGRSRSPGSCGASTVPPTLPVTPALPCPAGHHLGRPAKGRLALLRVAGMARASWTQPQALPHPGRDPALASATACSPAGRAGRRHRLPRQRRRRQGRCCRFSCRMRWHHALTALSRYRIPWPPHLSSPTENSPFPTNPEDKLFFRISLVSPVRLSPNPPVLPWAGAAAHAVCSLVLASSSSSRKKKFKHVRVLLGDKSQNLYQSLFDHLPVIDIIKKINLLEAAKTLMWQRI